jgi:CheY-like chemotaxis protein
LSGFASPKDRDQALAIGYRAHLTKPFEPLELVRSIESLVKSRIKRGRAEKITAIGP